MRDASASSGNVTRKEQRKEEQMLKKTLIVAVAAAATLAGASAANAAEGCGPDAHRGPYGHCRPNHGPGGVVVAPGLTIGLFYPGHGYWDGHRYYQHRDHWHGGWRYR
jgi:hypothetical protein